MLKNDRGRYLQGWELMPLLGFKRGEHLPEEGFTKEVQGVTFHCYPARGGKHRVMFLCSCNKFIPFGRAGQHLKAKGHI